MAVCILMEFAGMDAGQYEAVLKELGLRSESPNWPNGIISHVAGFASDGMYVVDVWDSQQNFDEFVQQRLRPAFATVGGLPQPRLITFDVHNSYFAGPG